MAEIKYSHLNMVRIMSFSPQKLIKAMTYLVDRDEINSLARCIRYGLRKEEVDIVPAWKKAIEKNNTKAMTILLQMNDFAERRYQSLRVLKCLMLANYHEIAKKIIKRGCPLNHEDWDCWLPLFTAVSQGDTNFIDFLIDAGADINQVTRDSNYALLVAIENKNLKVIRHLLDKGAEINNVAIDMHKHVLFNLTTMENIDILKLLLERGASADIKNSSGQNPLHVFACWTHLNQEHVNEVGNLIVGPNNINTEDYSGCTPLFNAVSSNNVAFVTLLLDKGAEPNSEDSWGETPLVRSLLFGDTKILKLLISNGADVNYKTKTSETALIVSLQQVLYRNGEDKVATLLKCGADIFHWLHQFPSWLNFERIPSSVLHILSQHLVESNSLTKELLQGLREHNPNLFSILNEKITMSNTTFIYSKTFMNIYLESYTTLFRFRKNPAFEEFTSRFDQFQHHKLILNEKKKEVINTINEWDTIFDDVYQILPPKIRAVEDVVETIILRIIER